MPSRRQFFIRATVILSAITFLFYILGDRPARRFSFPLGAKPPASSSSGGDFAKIPDADFDDGRPNFLETPSVKESEPSASPATTFVPKPIHFSTSVSSETPSTSTSSPKSKPTLPMKKPEKIVGLIFYGRRNRVSILNCYLQANLKSNGGMLDAVHFILNTHEEEDVTYIQALVDHNKDYELVKGGRYSHVDMRFGDLYKTIEDNTLYIKMDDDILFIGKDTISHLVKYTLDHPEFLLVTANVINHALFNKLHYDLGAIHPFLPEINGSQANASIQVDDWRPSTLPDWTGPVDYENDPNKDPPFKGHRWLPVRSGRNRDLERTPMAMAEYAAFGNAWSHWQLAAQQHYSFFQNLELSKSGSLPMYQFKPYNETANRVSIMFIAIRGSDINANKPIPDDDEQFLTVDLPKKLGRPVAVDGEAAPVAHYSSGWKIMRTELGLDYTDIMSRYKRYAEENICK